MEKGLIKNKNIASVVAILMLLLAIPEGIWSYGYYVLLRWVVGATAIFILYLSYQLDRKVWLWLMVAIAILFNPLIPIHLTKEIWVPIDFIVATLFLASIFKLRRGETGKLREV